MKGEGGAPVFVDMKKFLIIAIISAAAAMCVSCAEAGSNQDNSEITPAQQSVTSETSSQAQPDSSMFSVLPEGADKVLDTAAKSAVSVSINVLLSVLTVVLLPVLIVVLFIVILPSSF